MGVKSVPSRITYAHTHQLDYKYRNPSASHRFLGPDECPEFVYDPRAYNKIALWECFHCWRSDVPYCPPSGGVGALRVVERHIRAK